MRRGADALAIVAILIAGAGFAQSLPPAVEQVAAGLPASERERLLQRHARVSALAPAERNALQARVAAWDALPEEERRHQRDAWRAWQAIPAEERVRMRDARSRFDALPVEAQQALRARYDALDASVRRGWLLGPTLGLDWPRLHALFAQVPVDEQPVLLQVLRALSLQGRSDLAVLAQRTSPEERDALRRDLLALPAEARDAWLRSRVDPP